MHILIVKTSALGDIIHVFQALSFLRKNFPQASIDWVVEKPFFELLLSHPLIDETFLINTKKWRRFLLLKKNLKEIKAFVKKLRKKKYDYVFDFQGNCKSGLVLFLTRAKEKIGFDRRAVSEWPNIFFTSKRFPIDGKKPMTFQYLSLVSTFFSFHPFGNVDKHSLQEQLEIGLEDHPPLTLSLHKKEQDEIKKLIQRGKQPRFMVCMGSNWENKKLSFQTWKEFLSAISKKIVPTFFFVWKSEEEKKEAQVLCKYFEKNSYLLPSLSLPLWQQLMKKVDLVLSVDSAALHLAATTSVKTYSFFGPSSPLVYKPLGSRHGAFHATCPYLISFEKRCPKLRSCLTGACLKEVSIEALIQAFLSWYGANRDEKHERCICANKKT